MRTVLAIGGLLLGSGAASAAPDQSIDLGLGSQLYWTNAYDGGSDNFRERLLYQGDDFALYQSVSDWGAGDATDYFALFSGIYFNTCDLEMPTAEERERIASLRPFVEGTKIEIATDQGASFEVGAATEFYLMGALRPAREIKVAYMGDDPSEETIVVLEELPVTVSVDWGEDGRDTATLVTRPKSVASTALDTDLIGTCAGLLNTETDEE